MPVIPIPAASTTGTATIFAPRLGLAWSLWTNTVIRAGYALYYAPVIDSVDPVGFSARTNMVVSQNRYEVINRLSNPFPNGQTAPLGKSQGLLTGVGQNIQFREPGDRTPLYHSWNLDLQQRLFGGSILRAGYVGGSGVHLSPEGAAGNTFRENINQLDPRYFCRVTA